MLTKDKYPIAVLKALQPWLNKQDNFCYREEPSKHYLISFRSSDFSEFIFRISEYKSVTTSRVSFRVIMKPASEIDTSFYEANLWDSEIFELFEEWKNYISLYKQLQSPHEQEEDFVFNQSVNDIYDEIFELVDEDAYSTIYNTKQQLYIDKYLDNTIKRLETYQKQENNDDLTEAIEATKYLKHNQQKMVKGNVAKGLSKVLAKIKKVSFELFKEVVKDLIKDSALAIIKGDINISGFLT